VHDSVHQTTRHQQVSGVVVRLHVCVLCPLINIGVVSSGEGEEDSTHSDLSRRHPPASNGSHVVVVAPAGVKTKKYSTVISG